jgi:tRNA modification GTPase
VRRLITGEQKALLRPGIFVVIYDMLFQDTICAVSTPAGNGGIGIIRLSGKDAIAIASTVFRAKQEGALSRAKSHTIHYGQVVDPASGEVVDEALTTVMRKPATYTREDVVEINCHGGTVPLWKTVRLLVVQGARHAEPGEFTKRAFLHGRIDLTQAEAVMDIIRAKTEACLRSANDQLMGGISKMVIDLRDRLVGVIAGVEADVDFPEEDIETSSGGQLIAELEDIARSIDEMISTAFSGRILREGLATAIVGRPNVGKSSLMNALLIRERAIVADVPGTTRDVLEEMINISGIPLRILDTAGIRHTHDAVEKEGVRRSLAALESADIVLVVLDGSQRMTAEDRHVLREARGKPAIAVMNKSDLGRTIEVFDWPERQIEISCRNSHGLDRLRQEITEMTKQDAAAPKTHAWAINERHRLALEQARQCLERSLESARSMLSPEFIALDLRESIDHLGLIIGATHTEDILSRIFNDFCIGK